MGIRYLVNERFNAPDLERLAFGLLGVATPADLVRNENITPFNVGRRIELADFSFEDALVLKVGLHDAPTIADKLIQRVIFWTNGHPLLTQSLCDAVSRDSLPASVARVDELCRELFLRRDQHDNLQMVAKRLLASSVLADGILKRYWKIRSGKRVPYDAADPVTAALHLSGIVKVVDGYWRVRNRIYHMVFDETWIREQLTPEEARRQHLAARTARWAKFGIALLVGFALLLLYIIMAR
jgi:hypothetical protein